MKKRLNSYFIAYLCLWILLNLLFLELFPSVHSDEIWLGGLSRSMMKSGSLNVTESFFDLYPRQAHALKILYHIQQIPLLMISGPRLFSLRLLSLAWAAAGLCFFYSFLRKLESSGYAALFTTIALSLDIQFITVAHTGRQEIILLAILIGSLRLYLSADSWRRAFSLGLITGLSAGIHPNAYILAWPLGLLFALDIIQKRKPLKQALSWLIACFCGALFFALLSLSFNPDFIQDYMAYGSPLGVSRSLDQKLAQLPDFIRQLYRQQSGTYYLPDIRFQMLILPCLGLWALFKKKSLRPGISRITVLGILGIVLGIASIGKFSPPSISFCLPFLYLLIFLFLLEIRFVKRVMLVYMSILLFMTYSNISVEWDGSNKNDFEHYEELLGQLVEKDAVVLGNLNAALFFMDGNFYEWRNMTGLDTNDADSFSRYIDQRQIEYILVPEELEYAYENRPVWNALYGNPAPWFPQVQNFIERECELTGTFKSPYAMRVIRLRKRTEWTLKVYKRITD